MSGVVNSSKYNANSSNPLSSAKEKKIPKVISIRLFLRTNQMATKITFGMISH